MYGCCLCVISSLAQEQHRLFPHECSSGCQAFAGSAAQVVLIAFLGSLSPVAALITWKLLLVICLIGTIAILMCMELATSRNLLFHSSDLSFSRLL